MDFIRQFLHDYIFNLADTLQGHVTALGPWLYLILFVVLFCETGLVVTPFLPGDSLLFAVGAVAAIPDSPLSLPLLAVVLITAAVTGDAVNYWIGYLIGPRVFQRENSWLLNKKHLLRAQEFYERHGGKTIVLARFMPIIRTFAPFVAGIGRMQYRRFWVFNFTGGVAWVLLCLSAGYFFGTQPFVKEHFEVVLIAIVVLSVLPIGVEWYNARRRAAEQAKAAEQDAAA